MSYSETMLLSLNKLLVQDLFLNYQNASKTISLKLRDSYIPNGSKVKKPMKQRHNTHKPCSWPQ